MAGRGALSPIKATIYRKYRNEGQDAHTHPPTLPVPCHAPAQTATTCPQLPPGGPVAEASSSGGGAAAATSAGSGRRRRRHRCRRFPDAAGGGPQLPIAAVPSSSSSSGAAAVTVRFHLWSKLYLALPAACQSQKQKTAPESVSVPLPVLDITKPA
ncbi:hypothetical protein PLESTM_001327500 [Pleodorina starrii]|nr:hypothetical protein PLESTM_001327500 [Pleodorina starrii]